MINDVTVNNILTIYEKEISKNIKNKRKVYNFEINKMQNISSIYNMLKENKVGHIKYNIFIIYEPKCRLVMSLPVKDKIINHFITRYILEKELTKYLDMRNCATRKNMGTSYALKLLKRNLLNNERKYQITYILKIDIEKYFYKIDHQILKNELKTKLNKEEYELISKIIDSTNSPYINETINYYRNIKNIDVPLYEEGKGLPIGNMTSQFLSIFYLYKLDHFIVHDLKLKYYVRYMDDFVIVSNDKEKLQKAKKIIEDKLINEYKLKVNKKKTFITNSKDGFSFLGYTYKIINHKLIIKIAKSNLTKVKKKIKKVKYELINKKINYNQAFSSIMTYQYSYIANKEKINKIINRNFYNEK